MVGAQDLVIHDSLAHDSILAGIRLSGAKRRAFPHNDVEGLEWLLARLRPTARRVLVAIEGVYSMDGDIAPLDRIVELKRRHHALLLVDEAHSLGCWENRARIASCTPWIGGRGLWMVTLSKSLASCADTSRLAPLVRYLKYTNPASFTASAFAPEARPRSRRCKLREQPSLVSTLQAGAAVSRGEPAARSRYRLSAGTR